MAAIWAIMFHREQLTLPVGVGPLRLCSFAGAPWHKREKRFTKMCLHKAWGQDSLASFCALPQLFLDCFSFFFSRKSLIASRVVWYITCQGSLFLPIDRSEQRTLTFSSSLEMLTDLTVPRSYFNWTRKDAGQWEGHGTQGSEAARRFSEVHLQIDCVPPKCSWAGHRANTLLEW